VQSHESEDPAERALLELIFFVPLRRGSLLRSVTRRRRRTYSFLEEAEVGRINTKFFLAPQKAMVWSGKQSRTFLSFVNL